MTDPIADYLTRIRNAYLAGHKTVEITSSNMKMDITRILHEKGYILAYKLVEGKPFNTIRYLKYHPETKKRNQEDYRQLPARQYQCEYAPCAQAWVCNSLYF